MVFCKHYVSFVFFDLLHFLIMKNIAFFLLLFIVFGLFSCVTDDHKQVIVKDPDGFYTEKYFVINDSIKDGIYLKFFANGQLSDSCFYRNDTIVGVRWIYSSDGYLEIEENYNKGILQGNYLVFYPNGNLKLKQTFVNNELNGISYSYYNNGMLKEKVLIINGVENGAFEEFYPSGKIRWRGTYLNGENEQDTLYEFDLNGHLKRKLFCNKGVCNTVWLREEGQLNKKQVEVWDARILDIPDDFSTID